MPANGVTSWALSLMCGIFTSCCITFFQHPELVSLHYSCFTHVAHLSVPEHGFSKQHSAELSLSSQNMQRQENVCLPHSITTHGFGKGVCLPPTHKVKIFIVEVRASYISPNTNSTVFPSSIKIHQMETKN